MMIGSEMAAVPAASAESGAANRKAKIGIEANGSKAFSCVMSGSGAGQGSSTAPRSGWHPFPNARNRCSDFGSHAAWHGESRGPDRGSLAGAYAGPSAGPGTAPGPGKALPAGTGSPSPQDP